MTSTSTASAATTYSYEEIKNIANFLLEKIELNPPEVGIICGSGLGSLADSLENKVAFPYEEIPGFPVSTVPGHVGKLVFGYLKGKPTVCMQGRIHPYEGYPLWLCAKPVRVMAHMGVKTLIVTNAAGGLNRSYNVGDIMIIKDHINLPGFAGNNPLMGINDERYGTRFPSMTTAYDKKLHKLGTEIAKDLGYGDYIRNGVYVMQGGPCFETQAECRLLSLLGADVTGMSTVHEVIVARHSGLRVFGMSLVTNKCIMDYDNDDSPNHAEVLETAKSRGACMKAIVSKLVEKLD